jgi:fused signal recognition particle receptor
MFNFIKNIYSFCGLFSKKILSIFSSNKITEEQLDQFFELLISFDIGIIVSREIIEKVKIEIDQNNIKNAQDIMVYVKKCLLELLASLNTIDYEPEVIMLLGINGAGKTTTAAKLAHLLSSSGKKVLLVAADTFRAAAIEQLKAWSEIANVELFVGKENADPSSVIFDAGTFAQNKSFDHIIIDTAGRLHTNPNLLNELKKSFKTAGRVFEGRTIASWIILDSMLGQNSFQQVKSFSEAVKLDSVIFTKLDGSAKGGVVFAIAKNFELPISYITISENNLNGIKKFVAQEYVERLFDGA